MEELQKLLGLVRSEDPGLRCFALASMETAAGAHEEVELLEALRMAPNDPGALVRHQAHRTLSILMTRKFASARTAPALTAHEGLPIEKLQEAGDQLLAPLTRRLAEVAAGAEADPARH